LYRACSLVTVLKELSNYKLDLVRVQEVRQEGGGTEPAGAYTFINGKRNENLVHKRIISALQRVRFVSDRMSYIILRGYLFHIVLLNVHAPTEDKIDDVRNSLYGELERLFNTFPKYHVKILLGDSMPK
jgi:hypothetical protein